MKPEGRMTNGEWKTVALEEVAVIERSAIQPDAIGQGTAYLGLEHIESGGKILGAKPVDEGELASSKFKFTDRHVLYGKLRPYLAKIACPDFIGICSTDILPILPGPDLDRRFLCYFLRQPSMVDYANSRAAGANLPRLSPSALAEFKIPLPPLAEQRRIAEVLDRAEALRAKRRAALAQLDSLTQSLFLDLFGDPMTNQRGWKTSLLESVATKITDGTHKTPVYKDSGIEFLSAKDLKEGGIAWGTEKFIAEEEHNELVRRCNPELGDILLAKSGSLGNVAIIDRSHQFSLFESLCLIKHDRERIEGQFLTGLLRAPSMLAHLLGKNKGVAIKHLHLVDVRNLRIPLPPIELQREFARRVTAVETLKTAHRASLAELDALFATLQHRAFRGEL